MLNSHSPPRYFAILTYQANPLEPLRNTIKVHFFSEFDLPTFQFKIYESSQRLEKVFYCCCSVAKWCPILCNLMDCSQPGSSVRGILQAKILQWVAIPFSRGIFLTQGSNLHLLCLLEWQAGSSLSEPPGKSKVIYREIC